MKSCRTDGRESPILTEPADADGKDGNSDKTRCKYGELVILGWVKLCVMLLFKHFPLGGLVKLPRAENVHIQSHKTRKKSTSRSHEEQRRVVKGFVPNRHFSPLVPTSMSCPWIWFQFLPLLFPSFTPSPQAAKRSTAVLSKSLISWITNSLLCVFFLF